MRKVISLFLAICLIVMSSVNVFALSLSYEDEKGNTVKISDFRDTQGHWAHNTILKVAEYGLIVGSNGNFMPDQPIKRGDLAIILDRMLGLKTSSYNYYDDLRNDDYYRDALLRCVAAGYITGVSTNEINPDGYATREQVATIMTRIFKLDSNYSGKTKFVDDNKISSWAKSSVSAMSTLGYINGNDKGYMNPQSNITRAELVTMLNNIANTYIPKKDSTGAGSSFRGSFPTNIVTSRSIDLNNSSVGRDVILTYDCNNITLDNTVIRGRVVALGKKNIVINGDSNVSEIVLVDGKSSVTGCENAASIYICDYASESNLDGFARRIILEAGVRVKVNGVMYENNTTRIKTYYASELQADISDEQGYVVGGPKVSGAKFTQDQDNIVYVDNVKITAGDEEIDEIGVVWLDQDEDENDVSPTYYKNDGKKHLQTNKIDRVISFKVGTTRGIRAYRVYVKDKSGLLAYSETAIFTAYDFDIDLRISDDDFPEKLNASMVIDGDNIPAISSVRLLYGIENSGFEPNEISMKLYSDADAEFQPDINTYRRYNATVGKVKAEINGEIVSLPPTSFGYIITFKNGAVYNRYPEISNIVPNGVDLIDYITTGNIELTETEIIFSNNLCLPRYITPQEMGIAYLVSNNEITDINKVDMIHTPTIAKSMIEIENNFEVSIIKPETHNHIYYCAYVKTNNGYEYGNILKY